MIELVFTACSITIGPVCEQKHLTFAEDPAAITAFQCAFVGQVEMAKWTISNPNWRIAPGGWRCRRAGVMAKA